MKVEVRILKPPRRYASTVRAQIQFGPIMIERLSLWLFLCFDNSLDHAIHPIIVLLLCYPSVVA